MLSDDGVAAFQMLAQKARIDPKRIGFWGLSQGRWLALPLRLDSRLADGRRNSNYLEKSLNCRAIPTNHPPTSAKNPQSKCIRHTRTAPEVTPGGN